jgi:hypothetical protein
MAARFWNVVFKVVQLGIGSSWPEVGSTQTA